jgi:hypothetical protein
MQGVRPVSFEEIKGISWEEHGGHLRTDGTTATDPVHVHAVEQIMLSVFSGSGRSLTTKCTLRGELAQC